MSEWDEQVAVVRELTHAGVFFAASLNGVKLSKAAAGRAKAAGMVAGEPDIRIYDRPPGLLVAHAGMMIEMKTADKKPKTARAGEFSGAEPHQRERLEGLRARGWHCVVAYGARDALAKIADVGYPVRKWVA